MTGFGLEAKRPSIIRKFAFLCTVFVFPETTFYSIHAFVKLMKYIYWQIQVRVTLCDSFHTSIRIKLQDKTKLANFARSSPVV